MDLLKILEIISDKKKFNRIVWIVIAIRIIWAFYRLPGLKLNSLLYGPNYKGYNEPQVNRQRPRHYM